MTWQTSYYHYDGLGSTQCLTDENGNVTDQYAYTAFGEEVDTGAANPTPNPFRWEGQWGYYREADTADYHVRARVYRPVLARWLSQDPIEYQGGSNLYRYVANSPVLWTDESGLKCRVCSALFTYRTSIAALDASVAGSTPYKDLTNLGIKRSNSKLSKMAVDQIGFQFSVPANTGPMKMTNQSVTAKCAAFLFFVSFDICETKPGDCRLFLDETGSWTSHDGVKSKRPPGNWGAAAWFAQPE